MNQPATRSLSEPLRHLRDMLRWDPFSEMLPAWNERHVVFAPDFDIKETAEAIHFCADLPGVEDKDLEITATGNRLTISGKRESVEEQKSETWYACERSYGSFTRSFTLPEGCDTEHARASLDRGVLRLDVPKMPKAQAKKIQLGPVSTGSAPKA